MPTTFTFDTTHHALWAEELAQEAGIPVEVVPPPAAAGARCDLALVTLPTRIEELRSLLDFEGVEHRLYSG